MATAVRESYFPAIKCSMCNADVEITQLGDHICAGAGSVQETKSPKPSIFPLFKGKSTKVTQAQKLASLPKIDPVTANQTYQGRDTLTPSSSTTGSTRSPPTPKDGQPLRTPLHNSPSLSPNPQRSYTARKGSSASSSIYNIDSPFPPFKPSISPMSPHAVPRSSADKEFYPSQVPASPIAINNRSVSSRINNIAPGPFGVNHSNTNRDRAQDVLPVAASSFPERGSSKAVRANIEAFPTYPEREDERMIRRDQIERGEYSASRREGRDRDRGRDQDYDVPRRMPTSGSDHSSRASSKARRSQSPGSKQLPKELNAPPIPSLGFGQRGGKISDEQNSSSSNPSRYSDTGPSNPKIEVLRPETRANTFPEVGHKRTPSSGRVPPHPGIGLPRSPSVTVTGHKKNNSSSNLSKAPPTGPLPKIPDAPASKRESSSRRQPSLGSNKMGADIPRSLTNDEVTPPLSRRLSPPNPHEYSNFSIANPYELDTPVESSNFPSPSMSSNASSIFSHRSDRSSASATSSPPTPDVNKALRSSSSRHEKERRAPENTSREGSRGFNDIDGLMKELQISMHDLAPTPIQERFEERSLPVPHKHVRASSRGRQGPSLQPAPLKRQPPPPGVYQEPPPPRPNRAPSQTRPLNIQGNRTPPPPAPRPVDELFMDVQSIPKPQQQEKSRRPAVSKGPCRGCGEEIFGKSISSADGRLTGRYHKACFVCQDCRKPFESAEFYVHNNLPYCERHYHQRNQSLCPTCDTGIEGPCLETEWHERFHPSCFSCSECACSLGGDYFEFNGRPYCEQHAYQMQKGNNSLGINHMAKMERRKTRLTFM